MNKTIEGHSWRLGLLLAIAGVLYLVFYYPFFVSSDSLRYAISLLSPYIEPFNFEMSFGFYYVMRPVIGLFPVAAWPGVLHGLSALLGGLVLVPFYFLVASLVSGRVAFWATLFFLLCPAYWLLTRTGHPAVAGLVFLMAGLLAFEQGLSRGQPWLFGLSAGLMLTALLIRVDLLLILLVPAGLLAYYGQVNRRAGLGLLSYYAVIVFSYLPLKWLLAGYITHPGGGTLSEHLQERLGGLPVVLSSVLKNLTLLAFGVLPLVAVVIAAALVWLVYTRQWGMVALVASWVGPSLVFLPFWGMDYSRLAVPALPVLFLAGCYYLDQAPVKYRQVLPLAVLVTAHLLSLATGPLVARHYPFAIVHQGQPLSSVPIFPVWTDHYLRQDFAAHQLETVNRVVSQAERDVVIVVDSPHRPWYEYQLGVVREAVCRQQPYPEPHVVKQTCATPTNDFYLFAFDRLTDPAALGRIVAGEQFAGSLFMIETVRFKDEPRLYEREELVPLLVDVSSSR